MCTVIGLQPLRQLRETLQSLADRNHCVFAASDLAAAVLECAQLSVLLSRATKAGVLRRVCKGIYLYPVWDYPLGNLLFHAAARLRSAEFNYICLETVLSDAGVIPQVPINWISLMSSGRSHVVDCGDFGHIEFVHTAQKPQEISAELSYDPDRHLWRASVKQALRDTRATRRTMELADEEALYELI
jgi:predicted transcriptional regulator of viral defense system